jgi:predicted ATPase
MLTTLAVAGFRSLREVVLPLGRLTVVTGANGTGKSSLYRAFSLVAEAADGRLVAALAGMGGLDSVLWAGPEMVSGAMRRGEVPVQGTGSRKRPVALQLGFASDEMSYLVDVGLPPPQGREANMRPTRFLRDPHIKREVIWTGPVMRPAAVLLERHGPRVRVRDDTWTEVRWSPTPAQSVLDELADPEGRPEVGAVRRQVRAWRFYDSFRVDPAAAVRQPQVGTRTDVLSRDGDDLAPAIATILESAWADPFRATVADAFEGGSVDVEVMGGRFELSMIQRGMLRPMAATELSDGTLRFLLLATALLSPRPPTLLVLNEPETSLHPDVVPAVGRLIIAAAARCQVVVVTHSAALVAALDSDAVVHHNLVKDVGETRIAEQGLLSRPTWAWGSR